VKRAALLALGAVLLVGCGSSTSAKPVSVDEVAGRIGHVAIGDSRAQVVAALGKYDGPNSGFLPLGEYFEEIGGPPSIPVPNQGEVMRYSHFAALLINGRVYAMIVSGNARTKAGPAIGDSLADVRNAFNHGECGSLGAESGGEIPSCSFPVRRGWITFGKDPIKSITLVGRRG
jgi:hypothetical protein